MTKALDAAGASAPEAGELARTLTAVVRRVDDTWTNEALAAAKETLWCYCDTIIALLLKLAETEKRLAEADRLIFYRDCDATALPDEEADRITQEALNRYLGNSAHPATPSITRPLEGSGKP
jgi:hypothetical protein